MNQEEKTKLQRINFAKSQITNNVEERKLTEIEEEFPDQ